jgi:hypothetical protein
MLGHRTARAVPLPHFRTRSQGRGKSRASNECIDDWRAIGSVMNRVGGRWSKDAACCSIGRAGMTTRMFSSFVGFSFGQTETLAPGDNPANERLEQLVGQERDIVFNNATLSDLASFLEANGIPTYLDERALEEIGLDPSATVTFPNRPIRLSDGLYLALRPMGLTWSIRHGRLIITSHEQEEMRLITRVYDVRHLVELVAVPYWTGGFELGTTTVWQYDFDSLLNLIITDVAPETWDEVGGPGSVSPYWTRRMRVIVVSQTYEVHQQVASLLQELARHGGASPLPETPPYIVPNRTAVSLPIGRQYGGMFMIRSSRLRTTGE